MRTETMSRGGRARRSMLRPGAVVALLFLGSVARPVAAQGYFYMEVEKDGRIYVFNNMKSYETFSSSGEGGVSITRPGAGPAGETMIFDSEEAIHLYNFKHGRPGEVMSKPPESKPVQKFSWKDGKTTFESDSASLVVSNRVQSRFTVEDPDGGDSKGSFRIRRAKTKFEGWFWKKSLTYELQLNWPDTANPLEDAQLTADLTGDKRFMIKVGQFKVPFGRQELTSSGNQQFVDRTNVSGEYAKGRDQGIQIGGLAAQGKIDWRLGVFNGNGRTKSANDNEEFQYNGRLTFQPYGDVKYSESDFESTTSPLVALAVNFEINDLRGVDPDVDERKRTIVGLDGVFKYRGFSTQAELFKRKLDPEEAAEFDSNGWYIQSGMFLYKRNFEIAARYASFDPTDLRDGNDRNEIGIGASWFFNKHPLKLQVDWRQVEDEAADTKNNELRSQLQFIF